MENCPEMLYRVMVRMQVKIIDAEKISKEFKIESTGKKRQKKMQGHTEKVYLGRKYKGRAGREMRTGNANTHFSKSMNIRRKCS